jgi:hypothetical protein
MVKHGNVYVVYDYETLLPAPLTSYSEGFQRRLKNLFFSFKLTKLQMFLKII